MPALMAQSDAPPTGDQEVIDWIPMGYCNILLWRLIMKYFLWSFSPFCCQIQNGHLSVSGERMCTNTG